MSVSPFTVAHYVLAVYSEMRGKNGWGEMKPQKLLKLVYIAHGFHLAFTGHPLVNTDVEAWPGGPVLPEIYYGIEKYSGRKVPTNLFAVYAEDDAGKIGDFSMDVIRRVVELYGQYDGMTLSAATHQKGTPWYNVYPKKPKGIIKNGAIRSYYKKLLDV